MLVCQVYKRLGAFTLDVRLETAARRVVLFGPSGSGKSLTLQCLAGLMSPERGLIQVRQRTFFDSSGGLNVPPERRRLGYLPQSYALFPHLSVGANVAYGLRRLPAAEREARVSQLLELVGLAGYAERRPQQLSGGEQQRVGLARALAIEPQALLLDEPFSALDAAIRARLRRDLLSLQERLGVTMLFVTHDLGEAYELGQQVFLVARGQVIQGGAPEQVFERPASLEAARLVGAANICLARVVACGRLEVHGHRLLPPAHSWPPGTALDVAIRPESIRVVRPHQAAALAGSRNLLQGTVVQELRHGLSHTLIFEVAAEGGGGAWRLEVSLPSLAYRQLGLASERRWALAIPPDEIWIIGEHQRE